MRRGLCLLAGLTLTVGTLCSAQAVELLPTSAPLPQVAEERNPYAFENWLEGEMLLEADGHQYPALLAEEVERLTAVQARYDAGERPEISILNATGGVRLSVIQLPPEEYEGEDCFLLLPYDTLTDDELLQVVDAFAQLGKRLNPTDLSWHNCTRGGITTCTRGLTAEERERFSALTELYIRGGLRPDAAYTAMVADDGMGSVTVDEEAYCGLNQFLFLPARALTDEELLQRYELIYDFDTLAPAEMMESEMLLRRALHQQLGMPLSAKRSYESVLTSRQHAIWGDDRLAYYAVFLSLDGSQQWDGMLSLDTKGLISATAHLRTDWYDLQSDIRMDAFDPRWQQLAMETVSALRQDGGTGIVETLSLGTGSINAMRAAMVQLRLDNGDCINATIPFGLGDVVLLSYNDAQTQQQMDDYYLHGTSMPTQEE